MKNRPEEKMDEIFQQTFRGAEEELPSKLVDKVMMAVDIPSVSFSQRLINRVGAGAVLSVAGAGMLATACLFSYIMLYENEDKGSVSVKEESVIRYDTVYIDREVVKEIVTYVEVKESMGEILTKDDSPEVSRSIADEKLVLKSGEMAVGEDEKVKTLTSDQSNRQEEKDPHSLDYLLDEEDGVKLFDKH